MIMSFSFFKADLIYRHPFTSPMSVGLTLPPRIGVDWPLWPWPGVVQPLQLQVMTRHPAWIYHLDGGSAQFRELVAVWRVGRPTLHHTLPKGFLWVLPSALTPWGNTGIGRGLAHNQEEATVPLVNQFALV